MNQQGATCAAQSGVLPRSELRTRLGIRAAGLLAGLMASPLLLCATTAHAQGSAWPDKPLRFVVANPPAGPSDIVLRGIAPRMQQLLGQPLVIEN